MYGISARRGKAASIMLRPDRRLIAAAVAGGNNEHQVSGMLQL